MEQKDYRLAAIMFTDIHGFSRMMEKNESETLKLLKYHNELITEIVIRHRGTVIKTIGDALLVDFKNTVDALQSALEIQDSLYQHNKEHSDLPLLIRIGLHLGDIFFYENDALGEGINIASRLQSIAHPGCICMSQDVYNHVVNKIDFQAEKLGRVSLKNISKEIHAYEIKTPNIEFDPNHDKPRPGYKPGTFLPDEEKSDSSSVRSRISGLAEPDVAPPPKEEASDAKTRHAILADIKAAGRRLTVTEVKERYPGADSVIDELASKGILLASPAEEPSDADKVMGAVSTVLGVVEKHMENALSSDGRQGRGRHSAMRDELRAVKREIRDQFKLEIRRGLRDREDENADPEERKWDDKARQSKYWNGAEDAIETWDSYKAETTRSAKKMAWGFRGHFVTWASVSAFLAFLSVTTSPGFFWAFFPIAAWGMGIVEHFFASRRKTQKALEAEKMPALNPDQLWLYKKVNRQKDSFLMHAVSTFTVSAFLAGINVITGVAFPWAAIPAAALFLSLISHGAVHHAARRDGEAKLLDSLGLQGGWKSLFSKIPLVGKKKPAPQTAAANQYEAIYKQALSIKTAIIDSLKGTKTRRGDPIGREVIPELERYVEVVRLYADRTLEIEAIVDSIPMADLRSDRETLVKKAAETQNDRLRKEYERSVEEIDRQEKSFQDLLNQKEMLFLRLKSSVNSLKQMQIDIGRLRSMPDFDENATIAMVKQRTYELYQYLEDLKAGFYEVSSDPFKEMEEAERQNLQRQAEAAKELERKTRELSQLEGEMKLRLSLDGYVTRDAPGPIPEPPAPAAPAEAKPAQPGEPIPLAKPSGDGA